MTDQQINQRIAESCGWTEIETYGCHQRGWRPVAKEFGDDGKSFVPDYCNDLNAMRQAHRDIGLLDPANREMRVKWVAKLREVVARRCPVNKVGSHLVSDVDCILVEPHEFAEAFVLAFCKPEKSK